MRKNIKLLAIMFAFAMQSMTMWSTTTSMYPVSLYHRPTGWTGANPKPSKAPANYTIPLSVILDEENQQLLVTALTEGQFTYYIYNESDEVITQGILNCCNNGEYTMDLGLCCSGEYELVVIYNDHVFRGTFEIVE